MEGSRSTPARSDVTRRDALLLGGSSLAALLLAAGAQSSPVAAQEATTEAEPTFQTLGHGLPTAAPGYELSLVRTTFPTGGSIHAHRHPGAIVLFMESGNLGLTMVDGEAYLTRAGTATPAAEGELLAIGEEVVLNPGDSVFYPGVHADQARNAGDGPAVLLLATFYTAGEPGVTFIATPTTPTS